MKMKTLLLRPTEIAKAALLIRQGECVAFPTETVYGLGGNALDERAVAKVFQAKGRPPDNPLIVHCHSRAQLSELARGWPPAATGLMNAFWPGPLTIVLEKQDVVPASVSGGLGTVALRLPSHPLAIALLRATGLPVVAPSANVSGKPSPTTAEHVVADLSGKIAAILDGGATPGGLESTVLDCTVLPFRVLRPGAITLEQLQALAPVTEFCAADEGPLAPGMRYRHYSPGAQLVLVSGDGAQAEIQRQLNSRDQAEGEAAVMAFRESSYSGARIFDFGSKTRLETAAAELYNLLRQVDSLGYKLVFVEGPPEQGLGRSIMNRLRQAATKEIHT